VCRGIKPEDCCLDSRGRLKLVDLGLSKLVAGLTYTTCGTPAYFAPELIESVGHNHAVDWWTLGILIYEMIVGQPPFCDEDPMGIYQKILAGKVYFPKYFDKNAKALVKKLLTADLSKRFGNLKDGAADILQSKIPGGLVAVLILPLASHGHSDRHSEGKTSQGHPVVQVDAMPRHLRCK